MRIWRIVGMIGIGVYVGGVIGMLIWRDTPWFILTTVAGICWMAVAGLVLIEKNYRAEIKRIDKKFYEECQKINKG